MARALRTTTLPFRDWPWPLRLVEWLYRWTHGGQIRTLVVRVYEDEAAALADMADLVGLKDVNTDSNKP